MLKNQTDDLKTSFSDDVPMTPRRPTDDVPMTYPPPKGGVPWGLTPRGFMAPTFRVGAAREGGNGGGV